MRISLRPALLLAFLAGLTSPALAEEDATLVQKRDEKLQAEWLKKAAWITDYDKALAEAKASGKPIFAYFTRSYAH